MPFTTFETAIGRCGVAWNDAGITGFQLPEASDAATEKRLRTKLASNSPGVGRTAAVEPAWLADAIARVVAHLDGRPQDLTSVPLDLSRLSPFIAKVYRELQAVPPGSTVTYGELARKVGSAGGARAIGRAMATNPFPVLVPCHRVLASSGQGGFSAYGGLVTKERLLALEGSPRLGGVGSAAREGDELLDERETIDEKERADDLRR